MKYAKIIVPLLILVAVQCVGPAFAHASLDELVQYTSDLLRGEPANPTTLLKRAKFRLKQGNSELALADITAAERYSDRIEVSYVLGQYFAMQEQYPQAITAYTDFLSRYPGHTAAIQARAQTFEKLGRTQEAIYDYQYLLGVSRDPSPDYYLQLARLEATQVPYGKVLAIKTLDRGMQRLGPLVSLQSEAIATELKLGNVVQALARHESLEPWLGDTEQWKGRQQQLAAMLQANATGDDSATQ